jgi:hypothetical protein
VKSTSRAAFPVTVPSRMLSYRMRGIKAYVRGPAISSSPTPWPWRSREPMSPPADSLAGKGRLLERRAPTQLPIVVLLDQRARPAGIRPSTHCSTWDVGFEVFVPWSEPSLVKSEPARQRPRPPESAAARSYRARHARRFRLRPTPS